MAAYRRVDDLNHLPVYIVQNLTAASFIPDGETVIVQNYTHTHTQTNSNRYIHI